MTYEIDIAGLKRDLPLCKVSDDLYIGAFVIFLKSATREANFETFSFVIISFPWFLNDRRLLLS